MKKNICRRWNDVLEIFGNFLEICFCERLKVMECESKVIDLANTK